MRRIGRRADDAPGGGMRPFARLRATPRAPEAVPDPAPARGARMPMASLLALSTNRALQVLALAATLAARCAVAAPPEAAVITQHRLAIRGAPLEYTAEAGLTAIRDVETDEPHGYVFATAYRVKPRPGETRPIAFVWNGGPGADSSTLHFALLGPKLVRGGRLVDNPDTLLAQADLVFVDPVGTGYSRPAKKAYAEEFYSTPGDVASIAEFVRCWRLEHDAQGAPLVLIGESWGAGRAGSVGHALEKRGIRVGALVLISGGDGLHERLVPAPLEDALRVADLSATAYFHHRLAPDVGATADAAHAAALAWARRVYAPALERVAELAPDERAAVIQGLSRYTGLPAAAIDPQTLRISARQFRLGSVPGHALASLDMRRDADPAPIAAAAPAVLRYFRTELGYRTNAPYLGLEDAEQGYAPDGTYPESAGDRWNYATAKVAPEALAQAIAAAQASGNGPPRLGPPLPSTAELLALDPATRILVASGRYDAYNSCAVDAELATRLRGVAASAFEFRCYDGGHMMYLDEPARVQVARDVRQFVVRAAAVGR
jgi:carboxypeptidase C (cathepsin A)